MIVTAEALAEIIDTDFYKENHYYWSQTEPITFAAEVALQFAKYHVEECKAQILEKGLAYNGGTYNNGEHLVSEPASLNKNSIINAYPLENIK